MSVWRTGLGLHIVFCSSLLLAADAKPVFDSKVVSPATPGQAVKVEADIAGAKELYLIVRDGGDGYGCDWADWAEPRLVGPQGEVKLTDLKWKSASTGYGEVRVNLNAGGDGLKIAGKDVPFGVGTHANSVIAFELPAGYTKFVATAGLDDSGVRQGCGSTVQFLVYTQQPPASIAQPTAAPGQGSHELKDAVAQLDVAPGLEAKLFAGEPVLFSPSNIDVDHLGRIWVVEVVNYRHFANPNNPERKEGDRILVLEDTDGDAVCDKTTVFYQGRDMDGGHGVCVLGNRVIVSAGDSVFSLYDRDGDLKADEGSKEILFTGISGAQHDHGIHAFVFGPDGKLYFNFGNAGKQLKDKAGNPVVDKAGNFVNDSRKPYQEGMVFRCNLDGSDVETLGWNFRNNWEVCVDSFGTMWQSDNDDDGNRGVRINYVMEFGNYGYKDEMTGAGWQSPRTNLESEIPLRHWRLNDPGVVPNLLQTGAGSPTGICIYEGDLLPEIFRNQLIHCDAGPNVVRAYVTKPDGAGYQAEIVNILEGARDKWFRPSDVCVAPDGSLIIADWYDPGVGGHRQGDVERGRIFRVAPPGVKYTVPKTDFSTVEGAIAALKSPNLATRYLAWQALHEFGVQAEPALAKVFREDPNPRQRARAFWLLSQGVSLRKEAFVESLQGNNVDLQVAAIRQIAEMWSRGPDAKTPPSEQRDGWLPAAQHAIPHSQVTAPTLRQLALMLRSAPRLMPWKERDAYIGSQWTHLAQKYDGKDRWYLESLGIAAEGHWDTCLEEFLQKQQHDLSKKSIRDIIWRSRGTQTPDLLAKIIADPKTPAEELPRYFRAFDFLQGESKNAAIAKLAFETNGLPDDRQSLIVAEAINRVQGFDITKQPEQFKALERVLEQSQGTLQFLTLVDRFNLQDRSPEIIAILETQPETSLAVDAVKLLVGKEHRKLLMAALKQDDVLKAAAVAKALGNATDNRTAGLLTPVVDDAERPLAVRQEAVKALGRSKQGVMQLLQRAKDKKLAEDLGQAAAFALQSAAFEEFKSDITALYPLPPSRNEEPLPPLAQLLKSKGNIDKGKVIFNTVGKCNTCHVVANEGKEVGPNLTEIGSKLSREAMFESILYPSAGISHNYETWTAVTDSGNAISGIKVSDTDEAIVLKGTDAIARSIKKSEIEELKKQSVSLMPADLQKTMTVEELLDVIEYAQTLKKK